MAAETSVLTYYDVQLHYTGVFRVDGVASWSSAGWCGKFFDRRDAEAWAEAKRGGLVTGQDDVRVVAVSIEAVGPLVPVTITAPDACALSYAVDGVELRMELAGFVCVNSSGSEFAGSVTLTFAKLKNDEL